MAAALVTGAILAIAFGALGIVVSTISGSNRVSLTTNLFLFVALLVPTQIPLAGWFADLETKVNPMSAGSHFLDRIVMNDQSRGAEIGFLVAPAAAALVMVAIMLAFAGRIRLEGGLRR